MGGGSDEPQETKNLVVTLALPGNELNSNIFRLKQHWPLYEVHFHSTVPGSSKVPSDLYAVADILVTNSVLPPPSDPKTAYPRLKLVHFFSAGVPPPLAEHPLWTDSDVVCTTSSGVAAPQIAEWVVLGELAQRRKYDELRARQMRHHWGSDGLEMLRVPDGVGKTVGVLGYGGIGRQVGRVLDGLGWKVVAYTASARDTVEKRKETGKYTVPNTGDVDGRIPIAWYSGTERDDLQKFLEAKEEGGLDWLVVCVPLTKGTKGLIGREEFDVLGDLRERKAERCFVTNISRGQVVDSDALVEALRVPSCDPGVKGMALLRGAALDVTDPEPLPKESPLWDMENVVITPHISGLGEGYAGRSFDILEENMGRLHKGDELLNAVSRKRGY